MANQDVRVLLLEGVHQNAVESLKREGFSQIKTLSTALEGESLRQALAKADVVGIRSRTHLTKEVLDAAPHLRAIGCFCIGTNQVDLAAAQNLGIPVFNAPYSNTRSVAELVIAETISLLRGMTDKSHMVHTGTWPKKAKGAYEARGKTLGIVGYGNIGAQLSILAEALGMHVVYYDIETKLPLGNAEPASSLDELLQVSDVVSLHVPELPSTKHMIGKREFALMKEGAMFINAARGHCVVIEDLHEALISHHLAGAALDVFPEEPKSNDEALDCPLRGLPNVILTPHIGGSTQEAQANIGLEVAEKIAKFILKGTTVSAVNFPEISLPTQANTHRLLHIHRNQPGVLAAVIRLFAENNINISAQALMTKGNIGMLLMDVNHADSDVALEKIRQVDGTIRTRLLS
ncbi:phosphoglycerate dehydrogenase [Suttonella ornithocola]|uniref:D-3-phosphoglycerate dehydrogenase n=1 Tax=Suttonella ornithocola TaxID=279832 RepID=A0A380MYR4_9GAMM|nr:phosphoglycerate dehydrogenase [Suttonella ornithocola]SUO97452.1 D-3-phosphoglycerate dehydrogenase [Suttonella ornithocola]